jgi:hypothetical protein
MVVDMKHVEPDKRGKYDLGRERGGGGGGGERGIEK